MLATILKSSKATQATFTIIETFAKLKKLSRNLNSISNELSKEQQQNFKQTGEETVAQISILLDKAKIKVEQIVNLIKKWLGLIPNANYYYLEQEAKIKADKIIKLKNKD